MRSEPGIDDLPLLIASGSADLKHVLAEADLHNPIIAGCPVGCHDQHSTSSLGTEMNRQPPGEPFDALRANGQIGAVREADQVCRLHI